MNPLSIGHSCSRCFLHGGGVALIVWIQSLLLAAGRPSSVGNLPIILVAVSIGIMVIIMGALLIYLARKRQKS